MATFLELCQKTAGESGTVKGFDRPTTVTAQTGRLSQVVHWVQDAWRHIQIADDRNWRWLLTEFEGALPAAVNTLTAADLGITRLAKWLPERGDNTEVDSGFTCYADDVGTADTGEIRFLRWADYRRYVRAPNAALTGRPQVFSIDWQEALRFYPTPDRAYTLQGAYKKSPQELTVDADVPEMPARHHDLIWVIALISLGINDEATVQAPAWERKRQGLFRNLCNDQLPVITFGHSLA